MPRALPSALALAFTLALVGCDKGSQSPETTAVSGGSGGGGPARTLVVPVDHPDYGRFEAPSAQNGCSGDAQCVAGGCNGEVCAAESVMGTCDVPSTQLPGGSSCGCVSGSCAWYSTNGAVLSASTPPPTPSTELCGDRRCEAGEQCIEYYGIAGPRGPKFQTCGIPCKRGEKNDGCPDGKRCVVIADGPGDVCQ
ncbi:MAG: hypothetical protein R3B09_00640 [Nannocystaceae bacterium]